jgi:hypothetical protein
MLGSTKNGSSKNTVPGAYPASREFASRTVFSDVTLRFRRAVSSLESLLLQLLLHRQGRTFLVFRFQKSPQRYDAFLLMLHEFVPPRSCFAKASENVTGVSSGWHGAPLHVMGSVVNRRSE